MKKGVVLGLLGLFLFCLVSSFGFSQDAQKILVKVIEATGGRKAMEAVQDTTFSGTMDLIQMGLTATITFCHKEPNMLRQDLEVMGMAMTSAFDGANGWMVNPQTGSVEDMPSSMLEDYSNEALGFGNSWMLFPEKYGITFSDKGKETVGGTEYLLLEVKYKNGDTTLFYIDPKTYLPYKTRSRVLDQDGIQVEQESVLSDYKKVDGINFAHSIVIFQDGAEFGSLFVTEVKFNTGLEDSFFKK